MLLMLKDNTRLLTDFLQAIDRMLSGRERLLSAFERLFRGRVSSWWVTVPLSGVTAKHRHRGIPASCISVRYRSTPVPDWFRHRHFCSFRCRTDRMPDSSTFRHLKKGYTLHVHTAGGRKGHTMHIHTAGGGRGYTLHVHTAGVERHTTLRSCWEVAESLFVWQLIDRPLTGCQEAFEQLGVAAERLLSGF
jgi:hypothetical protein